MEIVEESMRKEIADRWVCALRSGRYLQTRSFFLNDSSGYCCLGVLCDMSKLGTWKDYSSVNASPVLSYVTDENGSCKMLPEDVKVWAGMRSSNGDLEGTEQVLPPGIMIPWLSLAGANDQGADFNDIADLIERNWEKL
jgi:hypothetical protein